MPTADDLSIAWFTIRLAALSTLLILPFGVALSFWLARSRGLVATVIETIASLPLVLPPAAVGLLLLRALSLESPVGRALSALRIDVVFTWKGVVVASAVMSFPLLVRSARAAFESVDPRLEAIARTLGHGRLSTFFRVTLPLARRGVFGGSLLAFARAIGEFGATILVAGNIEGETQTLALAMFQREQSGRADASTRLALVAIVIAFVAVAAHEIVMRGGRGAKPTRARS